MRRRAFQPETVFTLEERLLLSRPAFPMWLLAQAHGASVTRPTTPQLYPATEINSQYDAFASDFFQKLLPSYVKEVGNSATTPTVASGSLAVAHAPNSGSFVLQPGQGAQFGTISGQLVVTATVTPGTSPLLYTVTGRTGDTLTGVTPFFAGTPDSQLPVGTTIQASINSGGAATNAGAVLQAAITQRANQMAQTLVRYFNSLPLQLLPQSLGLPRQPGPRTILQQFVYNNILANNATSLLGTILSIPLPTDTDGALDIYKAAVTSAIEASRTSTIDGVQRIWGGAKIPPHYNYH